jgi:hypothetical protein
MQEARFGLDRIKYFLAHVEADGKARSYFESAFGSVTELRPLWESFLAREGLVRMSDSVPFPRTLITMNQQKNQR